MRRRVIETDCDDEHPWTLAGERNDDAVIATARKTIPHDGGLAYPTADRPIRADRRSEHQLDAREVVRRYVGRSETTTPFETLIDDVQVALAELRGEDVEA